MNKKPIFASMAFIVHHAWPGGLTGMRSEQEDRVGDYCDTESFHAECSESEVILMTRALYGRMRVGRCVEYDLGYIDCYSDVLQRLDRRCSGQRKCEVRIPDAEFESTRPCLKELKTYLEVSYTCVKGTSSSIVLFCVFYTSSSFAALNLRVCVLNLVKLYDTMYTSPGCTM